jgi:hypothetical protein
MGDKQFDEGPDGGLLKWGELFRTENAVYSVRFVVDGAVVEEPHTFVRSRDDDGGFEGVAGDLFLELFDASQISEGYVIELVESSILGFRCFCLEVLVPILRRRSCWWDVVLF